MDQVYSTTSFPPLRRVLLEPTELHKVYAHGELGRLVLVLQRTTNMLSISHATSRAGRWPRPGTQACGSPISSPGGRPCRTRSVTGCRRHTLPPRASASP